MRAEKTRAVPEGGEQVGRSKKDSSDAGFVFKLEKRPKSGASSIELGSLIQPSVLSTSEEAIIAFSLELRAIRTYGQRVSEF